MEKLINQKLEDIRKKHKLTRKGLEFISGFKERTIGSYERGEREISKEYIEFICLFFGVEKDNFYFQISDVARIILMYKSIYNYDNEKMAKLLKMPLEEYKKKINLNRSDIDFNYIEYTPNERFYIAEKLGIKPSLLYGRLEEDKKNIIKNLERIEYKKIKEITPEKEYYEIGGELIFNENFKKMKDEAIKDILERENKAEKKGINITPEYYASIIKQRNNPQTVTPNTQKETIPNKYKEILELLPYAPDSFIKTLKEKLETMKKVQEL